MELDTDDLPLMANTSHILVKHFALDLDVNFESQTISGSVVLFLQPTMTGEAYSSQLAEAHGVQEPESSVPHLSICSSHSSMKDTTLCAIGERDTFDKCDHHGNSKETSGITSSGNCYDRWNHGSGDFILVLDCCDLTVLKVEEVDLTAVPVTEKWQSNHGLEQQFPESHQMPPELAASPASCWKDQLSCYIQQSRAPGGGELIFVTDSWSLQIRKAGVKMPCAFPSAVRIWYKTAANGRSVTWTKDQSGRSVFT